MLLMLLLALSGAAVARRKMQPLTLSVLDPEVSSGCGTDLPVSCQNTTVQSDYCCFEANGLIQMVQLWDTDPSTGPENSWTIHGLWPNYCDGSYPEDCDSSRDYDDISTLLEDQGATSTLDYMNTYWLSDDESNEDFWQHEWDTHGTCYTTLQTSCFPSGSPTGIDAVTFFERVVSLFQNLTTYTWLEEGGVTPSDSTTYSLDDLQSAVQSAYGYTASFDCDDGELYQIEYWFNLQGSLIDGEFISIDAYEAGSCKSSGIKYLEKSSDDDDGEDDDDDDDDGSYSTNGRMASMREYGHSALSLLHAVLKTMLQM